MAVKTGFCSICQRTVYLGDSDALSCPVCASPLIPAEVDEQKAIRIGSNESLFREVNERIQEVSTEIPGLQEREAFVCECGASSCSALIRLTIPEYEGVRAFPARFVVVPGHEMTDVERVVDEQGGYFVVEKIGAGRQLAEDEDPRTA